MHSCTDKLTVVGECTVVVYYVCPFSCTDYPSRGIISDFAKAEYVCDWLLEVIKEGFSQSHLLMVLGGPFLMSTFSLLSFPVLTCMDDGFNSILPICSCGCLYLVNMVHY